VTDARDPFAPGPNEIDLRFIPSAGIAGAKLSPILKLRLAEALNSMRRILAHLARVKKIIAAQDAHHAVITLQMLVQTAYVDHANVWNLLATIAELEWDVVDEVEARVPDLSARKEFTGFKKNVDILRGLVAERRRTDEGLENVITYQMKACESMGTLAKDMRAEAIEVKAMADAPKALTVGTVGTLEGGIAYEDIKVKSDEFAETIIVDGKEWVLVDKIDILDPQSETDHEFVIRDAKDTYRTRQKLRYPDGTVIEDRGIAHEGGFSEFKVRNLTPHQDLVMIRRMDYVHGDYQASVHVNGQRLPQLLVCDGQDRKYRWRNWPYVIPAQYISTNTITVKQVLETADRDINMFKVWFYQPR
jgi:hypothetical protein